MKHLRMLGLLAVAAAALMAFAGSASATSVTSNNGTTPEIRATSSNSELDGAFVTVKCSHSEVHSKVEQHGPSVTVKGKNSLLTFTGCNYEVTVKTAGSLELHGTSTTGNAALTSLGAEISIHTSIGTCIFTTNSTVIGEITGSNHTGGNAVLDLNSAKIPRTGGNFLCGSSGTWTGSYAIGTPSTFEVHG